MPTYCGLKEIKTVLKGAGFNIIALLPLEILVKLSTRGMVGKIVAKMGELVLQPLSHIEAVVVARKTKPSTEEALDKILAMIQKYLQCGAS